MLAESFPFTGYIFRLTLCYRAKFSQQKANRNFSGGFSGLFSFWERVVIMMFSSSASGSADHWDDHSVYAVCCGGVASALRPACRFDVN